MTYARPNTSSRLTGRRLKDEWKEEKADLTDDVDVDKEDESGGGDDDDDRDEGSNSEENSNGDSDSSDSQPTPYSDSNEENLTKPTLPPSEAGTTLIIRNLPFSATQEDLRILFGAFGPLVRA